MAVKKEYYDKVFAVSQDFNVQYRYSKHYAMWKKALSWLTIGDEIIELGCGTGQFAEMLHDHGFNDNLFSYTGYDYSVKGLEKCYERLPSWDFFNKDINNIDVFNADTVIAFEFFEHVDNDLNIIDRIASGVKLIFSVPNFDDPSHVRRFFSEKKIINRYTMLDIHEIVTYQERNNKWFLCNSTVK